MSVAYPLQRQKWVAYISAATGRLVVSEVLADFHGQTLNITDQLKRIGWNVTYCQLQKNKRNSFYLALASFQDIFGGTNRWVIMGCEY